MPEKLLEGNHQPRITKKGPSRIGSIYSKSKEYNVFQDYKSTSYHTKLKPEQNKLDSHIFDEKYNFNQKSLYSICVIRDLEFSYPFHLENIMKEIKNSSDILDLDENWDDEGASRISYDTWKTAVIFLYKYVLHIYNENKSKSILYEPDIAPVNDGSIDLTWRTEQARLLINIKPSSLEKANYYSDLYTDTDFSKGSISTNSVNDGFVGWLKIFKKPNVGN